MILGYIMIGSFAGLAAGVAALILGGSFWFALALYSMVGSAFVILVPTAQIAIIALAGLVGRRQNSPASGQTKRPMVLELVPNDPRPVVEEHQRAVRILAVDDDPFILGLVPGIASKAGYSDVTCAASAKLALAALASTDDPYDCLLLDINMPEMDGIELCRQVRNISGYRHTPIIMLTGKRDMKSMEEAFQAGATDYATKPFDVVELGERLAATRQMRGSNSDEIVSDHAISAGPTCADRHSFHEPSGEVQVEGVAKLVSSRALEKYLTQLSGNELSGAQAFAVKIDWRDLAHARTSYLPFVSVLRDVATTIGEILGTDQYMMAAVGKGMIMVVANGEALKSSIELEGDINRSLEVNRTSSANGESLAVSVSVGRLIRPEGAKAQRAGITFGRAIGSAKNRALDKLGCERTASLRLVG